MKTLHWNLQAEGPLVLAALAAYLAAFAVVAAAAVRRRRGACGLVAMTAQGSGPQQADGEEKGAEVGEELGPPPAPCVGPAVFALGFAASVAAVVFRGLRAGHVPLQNLYEVFLCLGPAAFLLWIAGRALRIGGGAWDALLGAIVLFPAAFVLDPWPQRLPPALQSGLFAPHVAAYVLGYLLAAKAGILAVGQLARMRPRDLGQIDYEEGTYRLICLAMPLLTLGLVLGCLWGKLAWGDWWNFDPKELWSLATWLTFVAYLHFRRMTAARWPAANSVLALLGLAGVLITLLWANLSRLFAGLHSYA
jgi:ABC-type transport system involved in cytochrome c biogenesis permease subunit